MPQHQPQALRPDPAAWPIRRRTPGSRRWSAIPRAQPPARRLPACLRLAAPVGLLVLTAPVAQPDPISTSQKQQPGELLALVQPAARLALFDTRTVAMVCFDPYAIPVVPRVLGRRL